MHNHFVYSKIEEENINGELGEYDIDFSVFKTIDWKTEGPVLISSILHSTSSLWSDWAFSAIYASQDIEGNEINTKILHNFHTLTSSVCFNKIKPTSFCPVGCFILLQTKF